MLLFIDMTASRWIALVILAIVIVVVGTFLVVRTLPDRVGQQEQQEAPEGEEPAATSTPERVVGSEAYGFDLHLPRTWSFSSSTRATPMFNAYEYSPSAERAVPFEHHQNVTNVSVFPDGVPTEGVFAETKEVDFETPFELREGSRMFVLRDGTPFAAYLLPEKVPTGWSDFGFVWIRVYADDLATHCIDASGNDTGDACDPLGGSESIELSGTVDPASWQQALDVLQSLSLH